MFPFRLSLLWRGYCTYNTVKSTATLKAGKPFWWIMQFALADILMRTISVQIRGFSIPRWLATMVTGQKSGIQSYGKRICRFIWLANIRKNPCGDDCLHIFSFVIFDSLTKWDEAVGTQSLRFFSSASGFINLLFVFSVYKNTRIHS